MANFETLRERVTIQQVAELLEISLRKDGANFRAHCPICKEGDHRAFKVFTDTNTFYCWAHKRSGDIVGLAAGVWKCDEKTAGNKLAEHFKISAPQRPREIISGKFNADEWGKSLDPTHEALAPLGISTETYTAFGAGYNALQRSLKGMLCIPVRDASGTTVCFVGVQPDTQELCHPKGVDVPPFLNRDRISAGTLHVVIHPLDVLRHLEAGIPELANTIAVLTTITPDTLNSLSVFARERGINAIEFH